MKEIWKDAKGYENYIMVSNLGNVLRKERQWITGKNTIRKFESKIVQPSILNGYFYICINKRQINLHRIIANTFIPNYKNLLQVNHIDGNKKNNNIENLEWVTPSENQKHAYKNGLKKPTKKLAKIIFQYDLMGNFVKKWDCITDAHKLGFDRAALIRCAKNRQNSAYGYKWKY